MRLFEYFIEVILPNTDTQESFQVAATDVDEVRSFVAEELTYDNSSDYILHQITPSGRMIDVEADFPSAMYSEEVDWPMKKWSCYIHDFKVRCN